MKVALRSLLLTGLVLAVPSCGDDSILGPLEGETFTLLTVGGEPLPFLYDTPGSHVTSVEILGDEIRFPGGDRWTRIQRWAIYINGQFGSGFRVETNGTVRMEGGRFVLWYHCDDTPDPPADCLAPDSFRRTDGELRMENAAAWPGAESLVYVQAGQPE